MSTMYILKKDEEKQENYFPTHLSQFTVASGQSLSQYLWAQGGNQPWARGPSSVGYTHTTSHPPTHTLRLKPCRHTNSPHMNIFGMLEETRVPGKKPT